MLVRVQYSRLCCSSFSHAERQFCVWAKCKSGMKSRTRPDKLYFPIYSSNIFSEPMRFWKRMWFQYNSTTYFQFYLDLQFCLVGKKKKTCVHLWHEADYSYVCTYVCIHPQRMSFSLFCPLIDLSCKYEQEQLGRWKGRERKKENIMLCVFLCRLSL